MGGCFYLSNVKNYLRAINPRSLASAQFWNPLIETTEKDEYGTIFLQRKNDLLDSPKSQSAEGILAKPDLGGLDGMARFGGDLIINRNNGELFATAAGVAYGQGQLVSSRSDFGHFGSSSSNQTLSVLDIKPDIMLENGLNYSDRLGDNKIIFIKLFGKNKNDCIAMAEPKGQSDSGILSGRVKILYRENEWQRYLSV